MKSLAIYPHPNIKDDIYYGPIAQELEKVIPNAVKNSKTTIDDEIIDDFKSINNNILLAELIGSIKSLNNKLGDLEKRIKRIENKI